MLLVVLVFKDIPNSLAAYDPTVAPARFMKVETFNQS